MTMVAGGIFFKRAIVCQELLSRSPARNCALWVPLHRDVLHFVSGLEPQQDLLRLRVHVCDFDITLSRHCVRQHHLHIHTLERRGL